MKANDDGSGIQGIACAGPPSTKPSPYEGALTAPTPPCTYNAVGFFDEEFLYFCGGQCFDRTRKEDMEESLAV